MESCDNPQCYNCNPNSAVYCDKCIQAEINKMSYEELTDLYIEGKDWIDQLQPVEDELSHKIIDDFKKGWFALLNLALLNKEKEND